MATTVTPGWKFLHERDGQIVSRHGDHVWTIGEWAPAITRPVLCKRGYHQSPDPLSALNYVGGSVLAQTQGRTARGSKGADKDKSVHSRMRIVRAWRWTDRDNRALAIFAAESVLHLYETAYPADARPREAIAAAKAYLADPSDTHRAASAAAGAAARDASWDAAGAAARAAARDAARDAAWDAAWAAASAAKCKEIADWMIHHVAHCDEIVSTGGAS